MKVRTGYSVIKTVYYAFFAAISLLCGCASSSSISKEGPSLALAHRPQKGEPLKIKRLTRDEVARWNGRLKGADVSIIVHPGYGLFFDQAIGPDCRSPKCMLLDLQLENEAGYIYNNAERPGPTILVLPADPIVEGEFPHIYSAYLNRLAAGSSSVYAVFSKTSSSGALDIDDMLALYSFLSGAEPARVMIGGGYIGRCQREFYSQFVRYFDESRVYLVPEISVISPADVTEKEAAEIADDISRRRYNAVESFMKRKAEGPLNVYSAGRADSDFRITSKGERK